MQKEWFVIMSKNKNSNGTISDKDWLLLDYKKEKEKFDDYYDKREYKIIGVY
jgi:hypothetical protein